MTANIYRTARFMLSVAKLSQCPPDEGLEIAFAGRSNAGKSSAINTICDHKKLARASRTPGRTQQLNFFELADELRLVDLPGYGFAKVPIEVRKEWGKLVGTYLEKRRSLAGVCLVMDIRHPLKDQDVELVEWSTRLRLPIHVLLTKCDKLAHGPAKATMLSVRKSLHWAPLVSVQLFSSHNRTGVEEARTLLDHWLGRIDDGEADTDRAP